MVQPSDSYIITTLRETLQIYKRLLSNAEFSASQIPHLKEMVATHERALKEFEAGRASEIEPPADYTRLKLIDAVLSYLENRKGRGIEAGIRKEIVPALEAGGALSDTPTKARYRIVRTAISMNSKKLGLNYDADKDTVSLPT